MGFQISAWEQRHVDLVDMHGIRVDFWYLFLLNRMMLSYMFYAFGGGRSVTLCFANYSPCAPLTSILEAPSWVLGAGKQLEGSAS